MKVPSSVTTQVPVSINEPPRKWMPLNLQELWKYRDLLIFLTWRDIKVRYRQTILGFGWAIIQPVSTMIVYSVVFGQIAQIPSEGIPYPIFSYTGLLPWTLFTSNLARATQSIVANSSTIKKVYFPRLTLPIANSLTGLVDFAIAFIVLMILMVYYSYTPTINIIWLPLFIFLTIIASLAISIWLSALNVQFRDVQYFVPFIVRIGLFLTPVLYPVSAVSDTWKLVYSLNPMVAVIEGFRWSLLGGSVPNLQMSVTSTLVTIGLFITGIYYFRRKESSFADIV